MENNFYVPACKFCGQVVATEKNFETEEYAVEYASRNCTCDDAKIHDEIQIAKENAKKWIDSFNERQLEVIFGMLTAVGFGVVKSAQVKIGDNYTVKIRRGSSGRLNCKISKNTTTDFGL